MFSLTNQLFFRFRRPSGSAYYAQFQYLFRDYLEISSSWLVSILLHTIEIFIVPRIPTIFSLLITTISVLSKVAFIPIEKSVILRSGTPTFEQKFLDILNSLTERRAYIEECNRARPATETVNEDDKMKVIDPYKIGMYLFEKVGELQT